MKYAFLIFLGLAIGVVGCKNSEPTQEVKEETAEPAPERKAGRTLTQPIGKAKVAPKTMKMEEKSDDQVNREEASTSAGEHGTMGTTKDVKSYAPKIADDLFFGMYKSPCFGQCPVYNLDIKLDGTAILEGKRFFDYEGFWTTTLSETTLQRIEALADQYDYYTFDKVYDAGVTDVPSTLTILRTEEGVHWVYNRMNAPQSLHDFEREVETIIKDQQWSKMEDKGSKE